MTPRIVHFYFLRFRHIIRQFRHFVFRIGSYETDKAYSSAISLGVAAKTRTKRTNMTLTMAYCRFDSIYSRGQPYVTLSLLSTANAIALPATSGARGTECYRRSVSIVSLVVGVPLGPCLREFRFRLSCRLRYRYRP